VLFIALAALLTGCATEMSAPPNVIVEAPQIGAEMFRAGDGTVLPMRSWLPDGAPRGYIIRTSAETATDEELAADIGYLSKLWADIRHKSQHLPAQSLLYEDLPLAVRVLSIKKGVAFSPDGMGGNTAIACLSGLACIDGMATYMAFICLINLTGSRP